MSYHVLSRVCRPKNFDQVIGQKAIVRSLRNSIVHNRVSHAYIFSGTRGVGKTSMARIFAKVLRCSNLNDKGIACESCDACIELNTSVSVNFYEIDGASNNKVENVRDLIVDIQTLPSFGKYKIVIIDEVHMLSISAFNALLKTLEEPPEHIVFIFATTEPWKIPDTIISRCLRYDFLNLTTKDLADYILKISKDYDFEFESPEVAYKIASLGKGSVRDTLSLLDQIRSFNFGQLITESVLSDCLGIVKKEDIERIVFYLLEGNITSFKTEFEKVLLKNLNHKNFVLEIINKIYQLIISTDSNNLIDKNLQNFVKTDLYLDELYFIYETLVQDMKWAMESFDPVQSIEVVFSKICLRRELLQTEVKKKNVDKVPEYNSWESFLIDLAKKDNNISSKLEHLYLHSFDLKKINLNLLLSYDDKSEIFFEYFTSEVEKDKLCSYLIEYYKCENVNLSFNKKDELDKAKSINQIKRERNEELLETKKENLLNNPIILKAKEIFNAEIDKIKLN